jgi:2-oxoglutarate dehydrogenase complex dehydrogenase (E1) component-like enzyme
MANQGPQLGINAWLEEELLLQYHHDRASVDADWKKIFDHNSPGNGNGAGNASAPSAIVRAAPEPVLAASEELMPLRGAAHCREHGS